jgi:hypothetical protein
MQADGTEGAEMPATKSKSGAGSATSATPGVTVSSGPGLNELTIRRPGSRALTPAQEQAYALLCAAADLLRKHDVPAVQALHGQACTLDTIQRGAPVVVTAAYDLVETILRNEIVDAKGECTCWLTAAQRALKIRNTVSEAIVSHSVLAVASHPLLAAPVRRQIRAQFGTGRAELSPQALTRAVPSTATLIDAAVTGAVMAAALIQDTLAMAGGGALEHD